MDNQCGIHSVAPDDCAIIVRLNILRTMKRSICIAAITLCLIPVAPALAWDCIGHRAVTLLGLDGFARLASDEPPFLKDESSRLMAASNGCDPDRYRSVRSLYLAHENNPDHYLDVEDLDQFGLTLDTIPPLRNEYLRDLIIAKHTHPDSVKPYNELMDPARQQEWPGTAPYAVMEHYAKLTAEFKTWRVLDRLNDPARAPELNATKANVLFEMGLLAHFVGDLAQPLHTTSHHHGWIGDNPDGFTTDRRFHSYIDGDILVLQGLDYQTLAPSCTFDRTIDAADPWKDVIEHIRRSHDRVRPLYKLQKSGELNGEPGKEFITQCLCDGGSMLAAMYAGAWKSSEISDNDVKDFVRYDRWGSVKDQPKPKLMTPGDHAGHEHTAPASKP